MNNEDRYRLFADFFSALTKGLARDERAMICQFKGDPNADADPRRWRARVIDDPRLANPKANIYLCVSAMKRNAKGEWRRRAENFAAGLCLMVDDLGDGEAAKFPLNTIDGAPPTALIETSKGNFQAVYMFDEPLRNAALFKRLIAGFIECKFMGKDTGMAGVNRVFRPPFGINGKIGRGGWLVRLERFEPERRYAPVALAEALGIRLQEEARPAPRGATADKASLIRTFISVRRMLQRAGMVKKDPDLAGWAEIECPWVNEHTGRINNGAAIRIPAEENGWSGAFRCHHGNCNDRHWRELTDWVTTELALELNDANNDAEARFDEYAF